MTNKEISQKIIHWQLIEFPEFEAVTPQERMRRLNLMKDWAEGKIPLPEGMEEQKYDTLKKIASIKYYYFIEMADQVGLDLEEKIDQVKVFEELFEKS